jgi:putative glutamine amidotransferase
MKPVILVDANVVEQPDVRFVQRAYYTDSVEKAGGLPFLLHPLSSEEDVLQALDLAHGVVLTGSEDIDPALYGQERHEKTRLMHRRREKFVMELARFAYQRDMPLLAICGGFQSLAVALGGSLIQHIPDSFENALQHFTTTRDAPPHDVEIDGKSRLYSIVGRSPLRTNSFHHQALDRPPASLIVTAHAADGVIEAYEDPGKRFCIGVQWHPERMVGEREHETLFAALVRAASAS